MEAKELRIGNFIEPKPISLEASIVDFLEVLSISKNGFDFKSFLKNGNTSFIYGKAEVIRPIKLTEDWLLLFGFKKDCLGEFFNKEINIERTVCDKYFFIKYEYTDGYNLCVIKYVHQLQNLYFALTSNELKREEKK